MDRLSVLDDTFVVLERDNLPMHIGSLLIFDGAPPEYSSSWPMWRADWTSLPRYRQVIPRGAAEPRSPTWRDDTHFTLEYHSGTAVPHPGGPEQLRALAGKALLHRLDMHRPLWEMWLIEGVADNQFAILNRSTTAMVDGLSGTDVMGCCSTNRPTFRSTRRRHGKPQRPPSTVEVLSDALIDTVRNPLGRLETPGRGPRFPEGCGRQRCGCDRGHPADRGDARAPRTICSASPGPTGGGRGPR